MKLNKLQRYTAYCIMLAEYEGGKYSNLCTIFNELTMDRSWQNMNHLLPELFSKRTVVYCGFMSFWFCNTSERIAALQQCIIETHP